MLAAALCCAASLLTSCEKEEEPVIPVTDVNLNSDRLALITGDKQPLQVTVLPDNATNKSVVWKSSHADIASVDSVGTVTALAPGKTTIIVASVSGGQIASCEVGVELPYVAVESVTLDRTELTLMIGAEETLHAAVAPADATVQSVEWASNDPQIVTVNAKGELEAIAEGTAVVTATSPDNGQKGECTVTVRPITFTVTFVTNGGEPMEPATVRKGEALPDPGAPMRESGVVEGLYTGEMSDLNAGGFTFDGWYTDEAFRNRYDFAMPLLGDLTLFAKWVDNTIAPIDLSAAAGNNILEKSFNYLKAVSLSAPATYTLVLTGDLSNPNLGGNFNNANVTLLLTGKGEERVISKSGGNLFALDAGTLILGNHIKLTGNGYGNYVPVYLNGNGKCIMRDGARISDITGSTGQSAAVTIMSGTASFTMEGGEICNNSLERAAAGNAATILAEWGGFHMTGGVISGNKVSSAFPTGNLAGGVFRNNNSPFSKTGGEIKDNVATRSVESTAGYRGQQVLHWNRWSDNLYRKIDANIGNADELPSGNFGSPLWIEAGFE
jgi:uncharacterized repeat protein (TIGR02543 family)